MVHGDLFIFDDILRISLKIPSIRIAMSIGSGKNRLSEGHLRSLSALPFVNLQN